MKLKLLRFIFIFFLILSSGYVSINAFIDIPSFDGKCFIDIIDSTISSSIRKLFRRRRQYTTPDLYQRIMGTLSNSLMQYIVWCVNNDIQMEDISTLSNSYLENKLRQMLVCEEGMWKRRQDK